MKYFFRPVLLLTVILIELVFLYLFKGELLVVLEAVKDHKILTGLAPLLLGAPAAFMLWAWRDADKRKELSLEEEKLALENRAKKLEEDRWKYESESLEAERQRNLEREKKLREEEEKLREAEAQAKLEKYKKNLERSRSLVDEISNTKNELDQLESSLKGDSLSSAHVHRLEMKRRRLTTDLDRIQKELEKLSSNQ